MNIFFLSDDAVIAAHYLCDKHVGKMLIESAQLMSTAQHLAGYPVRYKPTHQNHPCAVWVRERQAHYSWVFNHARELGREFQRRFGKAHATEAYVLNELNHCPSNVLGWRDPPQCMPEEFRGNDPVVAYRRYYRSKASKMPMHWARGTDAPYWFTEDEQCLQNEY